MGSYFSRSRSFIPVLPEYPLLTRDEVANIEYIYFDSIRADIFRIQKFLSQQDTFRLLKMEAIYMSNQGKLLALSTEDLTFSLVEIVYNGYIPLNAMFVAPFSKLVNCIRVTSNARLRERFRSPDDAHHHHRVTGELSVELSKYIWPLDQDVIHVQFRSPVPDFLSYSSNLKVVFSNDGTSDNGEYCLAACDDGTVEWLPQSQCGNGNHVWTVHLFDQMLMGEVHLSQRLRRRETNVQTGIVMNTHIGGNFNGPAGTQTIGSASVHMNN